MNESAGASSSLFVLLGFLAVVLLLEGVYVYWSDTHSPEAKRIKLRLHMLVVGEQDTAEIPLLKQRLLSNWPELHRLLAMVPHIAVLDSLLLQAGSRRTVAQLLAVCGVGGCIGIALGLLMHWTWLWAGGLGAGIAALPLLRLAWLRERRVEKIVEQLPDALDLVSRALRAGHAFSAALAMVGTQAQEPIAGEFKNTFSEINFGTSTKDALLNLATRVPVADMRYFVMAVVIQLETGGNLAELLTVLGNMIRERFKLFGKVRVLAAEGKLSAYILVALPFLVASAIQATNPKYLAILLTDGLGLRMVYSALVMMALGSFAMWRIVKIRV
ncbi:MAG: type II secretion system F family protein [Burkholderiales bacterium]